MKLANFFERIIQRLESTKPWIRCIVIALCLILSIPLTQLLRIYHNHQLMPYAIGFPCILLGLVIWNIIISFIPQKELDSIRLSNRNSGFLPEIKITRGVLSLAVCTLGLILLVVTAIRFLVTVL